MLPPEFQMLRRFSILLILTSWSFAWFSASVHVHHSHDCNHNVASLATHSHDGTTHSHCHRHNGSAHCLSAGEESPDEDIPENKSTLSGDCPLCDLIALELAGTASAEVARCEVRFVTALLPSVAVPTASARYALRGRAPPSC